MVFTNVFLLKLININIINNIKDFYSFFFNLTNI